MVTSNAIQFPRDLFFGFDELFDTLQRVESQQSNQLKYPPYNVVKKGDDHYLIEIAVAGFTKKDIDLTLEKGVLTIEGKKDDEDTNDYIHKGISARNFKRQFTLAETVKVVGADLVDGMLLVGLENVIPEEEKPQTINLGEFTEKAVKTLLGK